MKTSKLLSQKLLMESWNISPELSALEAKLSEIRDNITNLEVAELGLPADLLGDDINAILNDMASLVDHINGIKASAHDLMQVVAKEPLVESYKMYEERKNWFNQEVAEKIRQSDQFVNNKEFELKFNTLIHKFSSWQYSTVYIRPNGLRFFNAVKATDILYVLEQCDITQWLRANLSPVEFKIVRFKEINENKSQFVTNTIPVGQIGLIVMEHFMHFKPLEVIKQYLLESYKLLKPGGHLLFTYNNCDMPAGAKNFEAGFYCYTPGTMVQGLCEAAGFEIVDSVTADRVSWFAIKKPGELTSLKGGKTLGKIVES